MKYFCTNCSYSYNEALGDAGEELAPGTNIDELTSCPQCGEFESFMTTPETVYELDGQLSSKEKSYDFELFYGEKIGVKLQERAEDEVAVELLLLDEYGDVVGQRFLAKDAPLLQYFSDYGLEEFEVQVRYASGGIFSKKYIA